jgi:hypothetical protein
MFTENAKKKLLIRFLRNKVTCYVFPFHLHNSIYLKYYKFYHCFFETNKMTIFLYILQDSGFNISDCCEGAPPH